MIGQAMKGKALSLASEDGAAPKSGVVFEVIAVGAKPAVVSERGKALSVVQDPAALDAASSG